MRSLIYEVLSNDATLNQTVKGIYVANSIGQGPVPANPPYPFLVIQESSPSSPYMIVRHTARSVRQTFAVRCYDQRGDYLRIENTLKQVRELLLGADGQLSPSGIRCTDVDWQGFGPDADDPELDLIFKACFMAFVSNQR